MQCWCRWGEGKGGIFNFGFLFFPRLRDTLSRGLSESANVEKCECRFEVGGLGRGGISEAA